MAGNPALGGTTRPRRYIKETHYRFWKQVIQGNNGCWLWAGSLAPAGYGRFRYNGFHHAHRFAYVEINGNIPGGLTLDHLCRNRRCVNPLHLEPVTSGENVLRGISPPAINSRKAHCPSGHEYTESNTYWNPNSGYRQCKICRNFHQAWKNLSPEQLLRRKASSKRSRAKPENKIKILKYQRDYRMKQKREQREGKTPNHQAGHA